MAGNTSWNVIVVSVKAVLEGYGYFTKKITSKSILVPNSNIEKSRKTLWINSNIKLVVPPGVKSLLDDFGCVLFVTDKMTRLSS